MTHSEADIERIAQRVAQHAVEGTLKTLGIDTSNPISAQQDFARLRALRKLMEDGDFIADLSFARKLRISTEKITDTGVRTIVKWLVIGSLGLVALVSKDWWITHFKG